MKSLLTELLPFFVIGILFYNTRDYALISAVLAALFLIFIKKGKKYLICFGCIFMLLGASCIYVHNNIIEKNYLSLKESKCFSGYILERNKNNITVKNYSRKYNILVSSYKDLNVFPGDYIEFEGKVSPKQDYKKNIMSSMGVDAYVSLKRIKFIKSYKKSCIFMIPYRIKYEINNSLCRINRDGGAFISGLVSGYTKDMSQDSKDSFNDLGISHILAVSGFNLGIIYYFLTKTLKKLSARLRYCLTLVICFVYTVFGGFEPSITRAFVMILILIIAKLINRYYDILNGISLSAIIMLLYNPFYIYNLGFLLSYLATYGIILFQRDISDLLPNKFEKINDELSVTLAALITTLPVVIWSRGFFSLLSVLVNLLVAPLIGIVTIISFLTFVIYIIIPIKFFLYPCVFLGLIFVKIVNLISKINILIFVGQVSLISLAAYIFLILLFFGYIKLNLSSKNIKIVYGLLAILILFGCVYHRENLKIHFLNVGQGDSAFIETPKGNTILIDTGPIYKDYIAARERVIPYIRRCGHNKIDVLLITHFHMDHSGGLDYILKNMKVGKVIVYKPPKALNNYDVYEVLRGSRVKIDKVNLNILEPQGNEAVEEDKNETCIIFDLNYRDFSALFTADAEQCVMDKLEGRYDIFKVPHHGSIHSFSEKMVDNSHIGCAVISVGKNNFGHPSSRVIDYLNNKSIKVYRTDTEGNITIMTYGKGYKVLFN